MTYLSTNRAYMDNHQIASTFINKVGRTYHTTCQAASHESKADKKDEARAPHGTRVAKSFLATQAVLVDQVDDENAENRAEARDPICESDVDGYGVLRLVVW
jgi:hypothetical protein